MLSIPKYPEQYAQHFPTIFYLLCCASQHHVMAKTFIWMPGALGAVGTCWVPAGQPYPQRPLEYGVQRILFLCLRPPGPSTLFWLWAPCSFWEEMKPKGEICWKKC